MVRSHWLPAYIGVGSNLNSPQVQVESGIAAIAELPKTRMILRSSLYSSKPLGPADQPDFINAVVATLTQLDPPKLLEYLQDIECRHGRERNEKWGPRTLDLDLLAVAGKVFNESHLTLPHPGIAERNFVLLPWQDVAPYFVVPKLGTVKDLAEKVSVKPKIRMIV